MRKIKTIWLRDPEDMKHVGYEVHENCQWVLDGEGTASYKHNGTAVLAAPTGTYKRLSLKPGQSEPSGWVSAEVDEVTLKRFGWVPITQDADDRWHREGIENYRFSRGTFIPHGTYELVGPRIQGNPHAFMEHTLVQHGSYPLGGVPRDRTGMHRWMREFAKNDPGFEGIVFQRDPLDPDSARAKIKLHDMRDGPLA